MARPKGRQIAPIRFRTSLARARDCSPCRMSDQFGKLGTIRDAQGVRLRMTR